MYVGAGVKADGRSEVDRALDALVENLIAPGADKASARRGISAAVYSVVGKFNDHYERVPIPADALSPDEATAVHDALIRIESYENDARTADIEWWLKRRAAPH